MFNLLHYSPKRNKYFAGVGAKIGNRRKMVTLHERVGGREVKIRREKD